VPTVWVNEAQCMETDCCSVCGILFAMPWGKMQQLKQNGTTFYCPNGHQQRFGPTTAEQLKAELERERQQLVLERQRHDQTKARAREAEKSLVATKGQITKLKKRVGNGVCPCCNRSFRDLARHMGTKHPDYAAAP
jgi:NAD-dependent SIR2 family protein deacetylase